MKERVEKTQCVHIRACALIRLNMAITISNLKFWLILDHCRISTLKALNSETIKVVPLPWGFSRQIKGYSL